MIDMSARDELRNLRAGPTREPGLFIGQERATEQEAKRQLERLRQHMPMSVMFLQAISACDQKGAEATLAEGMKAALCAGAVNSELAKLASMSGEEIAPLRIVTGWEYMLDAPGALQAAIGL